jgi:UDP-N-acetylglucosamine 2-epimerase
MASVRRLAGDDAAYQRMAQARNPYGDGAAATAILDTLLAKQIEYA